MHANTRPATDPSRAHFWPGVRLDLIGATLIDFGFGHGVFVEARFDGATFNSRVDTLSFRHARVTSANDEYV